jgi:hypothetical protein
VLVWLGLSFLSSAVRHFGADPSLGSERCTSTHPPSYPLESGGFSHLHHSTAVTTKNHQGPPGTTRDHQESPPLSESTGPLAINRPINLAVAGHWQPLTSQYLRNSKFPSPSQYSRGCFLYPAPPATHCASLHATVPAASLLTNRI